MDVAIRITDPITLTCLAHKTEMVTFLYMCVYNEGTYFNNAESSWKYGWELEYTTRLD